MTARTREARTRAVPRQWGRDLRGTAAGPGTAALVLAAVAAVLGIAGPLLPVVSPAHPAGYAAEPMLAVLAVLPVAAALVARWRGSDRAGMAVLAAVAAFAPGRLLTDLQLAADVGDSARPELTLPTSLARLQPGAGLWLLLAGHVAALAAGLVAARSLRRAPAAAPFGEDADPESAGPGRQTRLVVGLSCGGLAALALLASPPFHSADPFLLGDTLLDRPALVGVGGALLMAAAVFVPIAAAPTDRPRFVGASVGVAVALLSISLPDLVSGLVMAPLRPSWGPCAVLAAVVGLAAVAVSVARSDGAPREREPGTGELELPSLSRLRVGAAVLGVAGGLLAVAAGLLPQVVVAPPLPALATVERWPLVPAGALVAALALALLHRGAAGVARPAFVVAVTAVPLAAAADLDFVLSATRIDGVTAAAGPWLAGTGVLAVVAAACCAGLAGGVERDEVDLSLRVARPTVFWPTLLGVALAVAGFGLPVERAAHYTPPGLWSNFRFSSWGMVVVLVALCGAAVVAAYARPTRGAALLLGGAAVLAVRCAELPLTTGRAAGTTVAAGEYFSLAAVIVLLLAAGLAVRAPAARPSGPHPWG